MMSGSLPPRGVAPARPRLHLIAHARSAVDDARRFGFESVRAYLDFIRAHAPPGWRVTGDARLIGRRHERLTEGRFDDAARADDLNAAMADGDTRMIVALNGGSWFTRIVDRLDLSPLQRRRDSLWCLGFSEMTSLVNLVAARPAGRGAYWLCPNYLAWKIKPPAAARAAFAEFWRALPGWIDPNVDAVCKPGEEHACAGKSVIDARLERGRMSDVPPRFIGGCLSILAANLVGPVAEAIDPVGRWLLLEDINEETYRVDRHLATLRLAGWWERITGVLVGDFHLPRVDQRRAVLKLVNHYLAERPEVPVLSATSVGHVWPMRPVVLNLPYLFETNGRSVRLSWSGVSDSE